MSTITVTDQAERRGQPGRSGRPALDPEALRAEARVARRAKLRQSALLIALIGIVALFQLLTGGRLLVPDNIASLIQQNAYVMVLAIGMLLVIIAGHIDLSVGSSVAMIGGVIGIGMASWHLPWLVAVALGLLVGLVVGVWQGYWVAYVGVPSFIVTLGGMLIFRGFAQLLVGRTISGFPEAFKQIGNGAIPNLLGFTDTAALGYLDGVTVLIGVASVAVLVLTGLRNRRSMATHGLPVDRPGVFWGKLVAIAVVILAFTYLLALSTGGFPIVLALIGVLMLVFSFLLKNTRFGRSIYAIGGNYRAAELSGVNARRITFGVFVIAGVMAALAGIVVTSRAGAAVSSAGMGYELDAIAACFIGGAAVTGGSGKVGGAMIGALIMGVLNMGLSILAVDPAWQQAIKGFVLVAAVAFDLLNKRRSGSLS
ncbi:multiple monosaccharide ABC transporter permease [Raineyella fluvialis]|uniref:Xylose transport system permease protein XylH n=1 Tax=Raineyella fluvialis TaxID=2662261 RepID=A0A5Q2FEY0_9ACTN|nr:multiple monosaccharide ABC transporter permease [Raineyella fluvialis]QGF23275.1 sugar ABC transporter permease [Raineyella fluvialis]